MSSLKTNDIHLDLHMFLFAPDTYNYSYHLLSTCAFINALNPHYYLWDRHYPHFTDNKTEAESGQTTFAASHS